VRKATWFRSGVNPAGLYCGSGVRSEPGPSSAKLDS